MLQTNLDIDILRTFVAGIDLGSFSKAATRVGRSASAVSLQISKLEDQVGHRLLRKNGRGLTLTAAGETLLGHARKMLDINDIALDAVRGEATITRVRLGVPPDLSEGWLPRFLGDWARQLPGVGTDADVDTSCNLLNSLESARIDVALLWEGEADISNATLVAEVPMAWVGPIDSIERETANPVPLVALPSPCVFRQAAISALETAEVPWRAAYNSSTISGISAGVAAGLGITVRTVHGISSNLQVLDPKRNGLPPLPTLKLYLQTSELQPNRIVSKMADALRESLQGKAING